ncbi:hypothetical protein EMIT0111MI5_70057 [Burkholderia sp. IT-111MI5]
MSPEGARSVLTRRGVSGLAGPRDLPFARRDIVASVFPQCIIFVATHAFIACVRIRLVDVGRNQG